MGPYTEIRRWVYCAAVMIAFPNLMNHDVPPFPKNKFVRIMMRPKEGTEIELQREICQILSDLSDLQVKICQVHQICRFPQFKKNGRRTTDRQTNRLTDGQTL